MRTERKLEPARPLDQGVDIIKFLKWAGRIVAIAAALMGILIGFSGSWGDAIYAIFLAGIVWFWTDWQVARMTKNRQDRQAAQGRQPSQNG